MAAILSTSKSCLICRRRKKRCDLQPVCKKCISSGRTRDGYARHPVSHNRTVQGTAKRKPSEKAKRPRDKVPRPASSTSSIDATTTAQQTKFPRDQGMSSHSAFSQPNNGAAYEAQLISRFWDHYNPQQSIQTGCQCKWLQHTLGLPNPSPALRLALKALSMTRIGWVNQDNTLILNGRVLYSQALQAIQRNLHDERTMWQDETLAAGNILAWYELFEPTNDSIAGWNSHTDGVARLTLIRGPDRHRSHFGRALLEGIRISAMIQALQNRKASPLGDHEWCTRPWVHKRKDRYPEKEPIQRLYDQGFALAALFEDIDKANLSKPGTEISELNKYLRRCSALDATFNLWYQNLTRQSAIPLYWPTPPNDGIHHTSARVDKWRPFSFPDLRVAITIITFWGLKLALSNTIAIICGLVLSSKAKDQHKDDPQGFAALEQTARNLVTQHGDAGRLENATNIIRAMPYCLHDCTGLLGPQKSLFALRAALLSLRKRPGEELDMCLKAYQELVDKKGMGYAREVGKLNAKDNVDAGKSMDAIRLAPGHGSGYLEQYPADDFKDQVIETAATDHTERDHWFTASRGLADVNQRYLIGSRHFPTTEHHESILRI